ncbi:YeaC family protein [Dasania sp. GY-MA-18]|uniref:YeaC family protein n=1 Tax=Dasania phycosphaerae TaxID=2950436 RepID=A0A9J6RR02_9GAMM|nr:MULTISPECIES: YeaC family protein [Dasania]MCR8924247.1 YeaC family protein [Dasania sp. GY-MA-18]MCZ0866900.1 YeaC family protein [Dasania phycosphaerae]MCZ0870404.1 YeaC family protein [Dasania phycosphaerae]
MTKQTMGYDELIAQLTPDVYQNFKRAIELGKWPDGTIVSDEQKAHCMAAVIAYEQKHVSAEQRVGYIDRGSKAEGELCDDQPDPAAASPLKWQ